MNASINDINFNYYFLIGGLFLSYLVYRIFRSISGDNPFMQTKYRMRGHTWRSIECNKSIPYNIYVSLAVVKYKLYYLNTYTLHKYYYDFSVQFVVSLCCL